MKATLHISLAAAVCAAAAATAIPQEPAAAAGSSPAHAGAYSLYGCGTTARLKHGTQAAGFDRVDDGLGRLWHYTGSGAGDPAAFVLGDLAGGTGTWYVKNGIVDTGYSGYVAVQEGSGADSWYYVECGRAAIYKTGFVSGTVNGETGEWYVRLGKVITGNETASRDLSPAEDAASSADTASAGTDPADASPAEAAASPTDTAPAGSGSPDPADSGADAASSPAAEDGVPADTGSTAADSSGEDVLPGGIRRTGYTAGQYVGRLTIPSAGVNVALYYASATDGCSQAVVDAADSAAFMPDFGCETAIADHVNQAFSGIKSCSSGSVLYIDTEAGKYRYTCCRACTGRNVTTDLLDPDGVSCAALNSGGLCLYTCNSDGTVTLTFWQPSE